MNKNYPVLFPFYLYDKNQILMVLSIFNKIMIYRPWYAEDQELLKDQTYSDYVHIQNPSLERRPANNFKNLLQEYYRWMMEHPDRTAWESLKSYQSGEAGEEKIWEIRKIIRDGERDFSVSSDNTDFGSHLILHLAQENEKHRMELDNRIRILKAKGSVLEGVVEEVDRRNDLLNNLQSFEMDPMMEESHLAYVVESWLSLFGDSLSDAEPLVTFERPVFDLIKDGFTEIRGETGSADILLQEIEFPDLSIYELNEIIDKKNREPLRGIIEAFLTQLQGVNLGTKTPFSIASEPVGEEEEIRVSPGRLHLEIMYYDLLQVEGYSKVPKIIKELNKRVIIHLKQVSGR